MVKRGRKSADELATITPLTGTRPDAPYDLTDDQAEEWRAIVDRMPADWFPRETWGVLSAYCRHVVTARRISALVDAFKPEWLKDDDGLKRFDRLAALRERETKALLACARSLRIAKSSQLKAETAYRRAQEPGVGPRPWD